MDLVETVLDGAADQAQLAELKAGKERLDGVLGTLRESETVGALVAEAQACWQDAVSSDARVADLAAQAQQLLGAQDSDETRSAAMSLVRDKVAQNKESLHSLLAKSPGLLAKLREGDGAKLADSLEARTGGRVKVKVRPEDMGLASLSDGSDALLRDKADLVAGKVRELRSSERGQELLAKGAALLSKSSQSPQAEELTRALASLDVGAVLDKGEEVLRDEAARTDFLHKVSDIVLNLLISYLPTVSLPPIEGEKDGLLYTVENLDLKGFQLRREDVRVTLNGFAEVEKGAPLLTIAVFNVEAHLENIKWTFKQNYFPHLGGAGAADAHISHGCVRLGVQLVKSGKSEQAQREVGEDREGGEDGEGGESGKDGAGGEGLRPELLLSGCDVSIEQVSVQVADTQLSWLYNSMSEIFADSIRLYITSLLQDNLGEHLASLSGALNDFVAEHWAAVAAIVEVDLADLPDKATAEEFGYQQRLRARDLGAPPAGNVYSVTFADTGQLGIALAQRRQFVVVKSLRRGPADEVLPAERGGQVRPGDVLVAFNGQQVTSLPMQRVMQRLKRSGRPLHLTFMVPPGGRSASANGSASVPVSQSQSQSQSWSQSQSQSQVQPGRGQVDPKMAGEEDMLGPQSGPQSSSSVVDVEFGDARLYMTIKSRFGEAGLDECGEEQFACVVKGFRRKEDGSPGPAEACGRLAPGMVLARVNGESALGCSFNRVLALLKGAKEKARPLLLRFGADPEYTVVFEGEGEAGRPDDLTVSQLPGGLAVVTALAPCVGAAERQCAGALSLGDVVVAVNGEPLVRGLGNFAASVDKIRSATFPKRLRFSSECEARFDAPGPLGIVFFRTAADDVAFKAFSATPGPAKRSGRIAPGHVLLQIYRGSDGDEVPVPRDEAELRRVLREAPMPLKLRFRDMDMYQRLA